MISGGTVGDSRRIARAGLVTAVAITICLSSGYSYAGPAVLLNPEGQFQFAEHYFQKGEYYRAIGEYERFIYFFPEARQVELASYKIGLAYLRGERYQEAIQALELLIERAPNSAHAIKAYLRIGEAYVQLKRYDEALINFENLITVAPDQNIRDDAYYECGWVYLEKGFRENAQACFDKISAQNREKYRLRKLLKGILSGGVALNVAARISSMIKHGYSQQSMALIGNRQHTRPSRTFGRITYRRFIVRSEWPPGPNAFWTISLVKTQ